MAHRNSGLTTDTYLNPDATLVHEKLTEISDPDAKIWTPDVEEAFQEALSSFSCHSGRQKIKSDNGKLYGMFTAYPHAEYVNM